MNNSDTISSLLGPLALAGGAAMALAQYFIWFYAPVEAPMGLVQKIFYLHLPVAWWGLISFFIVFCASIAVLVRKSPVMDQLAVSAAEVGLLLSTLTLATGSLWARVSWNTWWTWDPRLSTALIMWFIYAGYLVLRQSIEGQRKMRMVAAVLGVVAFLNVPLVFLSARMWRSIHPAVFASEGGGLEPEMMTTVVVCVIAMGLVTAALILMRFRQKNLQERLWNLYTYRD
ncbi:cytochrome c biogenesis protein CcsA [Desulfonatronospira sp.]|uniref:cytochrome c biogenesis protein CcsA n=1 Tax=Desulfonatronospira sp. TaxID=1962951 RepID=UPI0025BE05DC|nr:cytochrome c biogenesis protein CcsA [Desulfonatronospira sp.]